MLKGKGLEKRANAVNFLHRKKGTALILQIPTPLILTKKGIIPQESTVDFAGLIKGGKFLAFDAKETRNKTSFPLANIKQHQFIYLDMVDKLGGLAFFLIHFTSVYKDHAFITPVSFIREFTEKNKRKSIPITEFKKEWLVAIESYLEGILKDECK